MGIGIDVQACGYVGSLSTSLSTFCVCVMEGGFTTSSAKLLSSESNVLGSN